MAYYYQTPTDLSDLNAQIVAITASQSFLTSTIMTVATALATYPAGVAYRGKYVRVSDLWGLVDGVMRCGYNGRIYYWEPTTQNTLTVPVTLTGNMTVQPLISAPIMELGGSLPALTTWNLTLGTDNLWPGAIKEVRGTLSSLLGTLNILGTGIGSTLSLALNANKRFACIDNGSALVWRQLT